MTRLFTVVVCLTALFTLACGERQVPTRPSSSAAVTPASAFQVGGEQHSWSTSSLIGRFEASGIEVGVSPGHVLAPANLMAIVKGTTVELSWTAPPDGLAVSYLIEVGSAPGLANLALFFSAGTSFAGAAPNGTYFVRIRAVEADGSRGAATSNEAAVVVTSGNPELTFNAPQPVNGRVGERYFFSFCTSPDNNGANCAGAPGVLFGGAPPYHFQLDTFGRFPPIGLILAPNGALTGTPSGTVTNHSFKVCAVDTTGVNRCPTVTITIGPRECITPSAPTGVMATVNGTTVTVNWNRVDGATSYVLEAGTSPGGTDAFNGDIGAVNSLTAPGVPNGRYYIRVRGKSGCGATGGASAEVTALVGGTSSATYTGRHTGTGSYFRSSNGCTWTPTYAGTITVALRQGTAGLTGTIRVAGTENVPLGRTSTPNFTCSSSSFSYDVTEAVTVTGATISRSGMSIEASTGSFSGTLSGNSIAGTFNLQYTRGTGSISMPVTLTLTGDAREMSGFSPLTPAPALTSPETSQGGRSAFMGRPQ